MCVCRPMREARAGTHIATGAEGSRVALEPSKAGIERGRGQFNCIALSRAFSEAN